MASPKRGGPANNKDDRKSPARGGPRGSTTRATARAPRARGAAQERQPMKPGGGVNTVGAPGRLPAWAITARKPVTGGMVDATHLGGDPNRPFSEEAARLFMMEQGRGRGAPYAGQFHGIGSPHARFALEGGGADFAYPGRAEMERMIMEQNYPGLRPMMSDLGRPTYLSAAPFLPGETFPEIGYRDPGQDYGHYRAP